MIVSRANEDSASTIGSDGSASEGDVSDLSDGSASEGDVSDLSDVSASESGMRANESE